MHGHFSYSERLSRLKLQSIEYRRLIADLLWCYTVVDRGVGDWAAAQGTKGGGTKEGKAKLTGNCRAQ